MPSNDFNHFLSLTFTAIFTVTLTQKLSELAEKFTVGVQPCIFIGLFFPSILSIFIFWETIHKNQHDYSKSYNRALSLAWTLILALSPYAAFQIALVIADFYSNLWPFEIWAIIFAFGYFVFVTSIMIISKKAYSLRIRKSI